MENPAGHGPAEKIIRAVYKDWWENVMAPAVGRQPRIGLSLERQIADALRDAGLLKEGA